MKSVYVTAKFGDANTSVLLFLQEPADGPHPYPYPQFAGVAAAVFPPMTAVTTMVGDCVDVEGNIIDQEGRTLLLLSAPPTPSTGCGTFPMPLDLSSSFAQVASDPNRHGGQYGPLAEVFEGTLVQFTNLEVVQAPDAFLVARVRPIAGVATLGLDVSFLDWPWPAVGDVLSRVTGVFDHRSGVYRLMPRGAADLQ
jgi:hypothetical protein